MPKDNQVIKLFQEYDGRLLIVWLKDGPVYSVFNIACGYDMGDEFAHITSNISPEIEKIPAHFFYTSSILEIIDGESGLSIFRDANTVDDNRQTKSRDTFLIEWLQDWYVAHCNDRWEHGYGVTIETLDNPGWRVEIDLEDTSLEGRAFETVDMDKSDNEWVFCHVEGKKFKGYSGPHQLGLIISSFKDWVENGSRA